MPGVTDHEGGEVVYVPYFGWKNWDICKRIEKETGLKVTVDNDANAIALAELWFGRDKIRKVRNFVTVLVGEGIGTGVVFEGQIYRGEKGDAGEFGHMIVGSDAPVACSCGGRKCWEAFASNISTQTRFERLVSGNGYVGQSVFDLAVEGNEHARQTVAETAGYLAVGISNLIVGLGPQAVVVSGKITKVWDQIADELRHSIEESIRRPLPNTLITASSLPEDPTLIGAVSLVLARKFASAS